MPPKPVVSTYGNVSESDCYDGKALDHLTSFGAVKNFKPYVSFDAIPKGGKFANPDDV